jgi:hypothetical protein
VQRGSFKLINDHHNLLCYDFTGQIMILVATAVVVIVNMLVKIALNIMTQFEGHDTITGATLSKAGKVQAQPLERAVVQSVELARL